MERIKGRLGFGCMRLPLTDGEVDIPAFCDMVDLFIKSGFNYFDTAHGYIDEKSEGAVRRALCERYPREAFVLTDKLTGSYFKCREDILPFFESQLQECGVDYFDFYLMHSQNKSSYEHFKRCGAYEVAGELKASGKVRHIGISFHDTAEVLAKILDEQPQIEIVQLQVNYLDYDSPSVQSRLCLEECKRRGIPVIVMEPVKGGRLASLPEEAQALLDKAKMGSAASAAIRFAAGCDGVVLVLSGMGSMDMVRDNARALSDFRALDEGEQKTLERVRKMLEAESLIGCTNCRYCVKGCPAGIKIPDLISCYNKTKLGDWCGKYYYERHTDGAPKPNDCIGCGACEDICPQGLDIRRILLDIHNMYDNEADESDDGTRNNKAVDLDKETDENDASIAEGLEDKADGILYTVQNTLLGERESLYSDIPATMESPDGFRRIVKHMTRRNLALKFIKNPRILLTIIGITMAIIVLISLFKG
ncbi:MAG: aldo/keto reductase [Clostridia bacterium]|nr:aldo/keto reductase [Clostridia bacterium]